MMSKRFLLFLMFCNVAFVAPALADPCEGPLPNREGMTFSGTIRYVGDGDSLCVGLTEEPSEWIEVRLADYDAPELNKAGGKAAKDLLGEIALGRETACVAVRGRSGRVVSYDRVIAHCKIGDEYIGDALRKAGGQEGGN